MNIHNYPLLFIKSSRKLLVFFIVLFVILLLIGYFYYSKGKEDRLNNIRKQLKSATSLKTLHIEQWQNERLSDARFLFYNETLTKRLAEISAKNDKSPIPAITKMYENRKYEHIAFLNSNMDIFISIPEGLPLYVSDYTKALMKESFDNDKIIFSDPSVDSRNNMLFCDLIIPISFLEKSKRKLIGWVILRMDLNKSIYTFLSKWPLLTESYETIIAKKDGDYLTYLKDVKDLSVKPLVTKVKISDLSISDLHGDLNKEATFFAVDYRGKNVIIASQVVSNTSWLVMNKVDVDDVIGRFINRTIFIGFLITSLLIASFVSFVMFLNSKEQELKLIAYKENIDKLNREKENEKKILHLNRLYSVLSAVNRAIVRIYSERDLLERTCKILFNIGGFRLVWIGQVDYETNLVKPIVFFGLNDGYLESIKISIDENIPEGKGPTGTALREGRFVICNDILNDHSMAPWIEKAKQRGFRSSGSFPIIVKGNLYGSLNLYSAEIGFFDDAETELCLEIANDIAFAIESITERNLRKKAEQALRRLNENLEMRIKTEIEKSREKDLILLRQSRYVIIAELMNRISHQWRQPLNAVGLVLQNLEDMCECSGQKKQEVKENIRLGMEKLFALSVTIDNFKNFFMPDGERCNFTVQQAIDNAINLMRDSLMESNISILNDCNQGEIFINGFKNEFSQVIINILSNAMEVSIARKVINPMVRFECEVIDGKVMLSITDNAGGIDKDIIDRIFEPYFTTKFEAEGVGLGLYMAKMMIEKNMGGTLMVKNMQEGAQFTISLPFASANKEFKV